MHAQANVAYSTRSDWDAGTITTIVGGIVALITAIFGGGNLWNYFKDRKKVDADANVALISGFVSLDKQAQSRIERLELRNEEQETVIQKKSRHIVRLERLLNHQQIDFPPEEP